MSELKDSIAQYIGDNIMPGTPTQAILDSSSLFEDGLVDSLGLQQILVFIESEYDVEVDEDDLVPENFENVEGIVRLVSKLQAA